MVVGSVKSTTIGTGAQSGLGKKCDCLFLSWVISPAPNFSMRHGAFSNISFEPQLVKRPNLVNW